MSQKTDMWGDETLIYFYPAADDVLLAIQKISIVPSSW